MKGQPRLHSEFETLTHKRGGRGKGVKGKRRKKGGGARDSQPLPKTHDTHVLSSTLYKSVTSATKVH